MTVSDLPNRFDVVVPRENNGKTFFTNVGVAFLSRAGNSYRIIFNALPIPQANGEVIALLLEPRDNDSRPNYGDKAERGAPAPRPNQNREFGKPREQAPDYNKVRDEMDDSIPF